MRHLRVYCIVVMLLLFGIEDSWAVNVERQRRIKAAVIFHVTKFIDWPMAEKGYLELCVEENDPLVSYLRATISGAKVKNRQLRLKTINTSSTDVADCSSIYLGGLKESEALAILQGLEALPIAVIAEKRYKNLLPLVYLYEKENKIKLEVNLNASKSRGIRVSAELLQVAEKVIGN